jgi:hypothetical protein
LVAGAGKIRNEKLISTPFLKFVTRFSNDIWGSAFYAETDTESMDNL